MNKLELLIYKEQIEARIKARRFRILVLLVTIFLVSAFCAGGIAIIGNTLIVEINALALVGMITSFVFMITTTHKANKKIDFLNRTAEVVLNNEDRLYDVNILNDIIDIMSKI